MSSHFDLACRFPSDIATTYRSAAAVIIPSRVRNHMHQAWATPLSTALAHLESLKLARETHFNAKFPWAFEVGSGVQSLLQRLVRDDRMTRRLSRAIDKCQASISAREKIIQARLRRGQAKRRSKQQRRRERKERRPWKCDTPPPRSSSASVTPSARVKSSTTVPSGPQSAAAAERSAFFARCAYPTRRSVSPPMLGTPKT